MFRTIFFAFASSMIFLFSCAQNTNKTATFAGENNAIEKGDFDRLIARIKKGDYHPVEKFLKENEISMQQNPEYYVILLNYAIYKGKESQVEIGSGQPSEGDIQLADQRTGETAGYLQVRTEYNESLILDSIQKTRAALDFFQSRLDIHFGIVLIGIKIQRWDIASEQLLTILNTSKAIENKWTWGSINAMEGNPESFMIDNVQGKLYIFLDAMNPEADNAIEKVSKRMIDLYPKVIYGYSNLGVIYSIQKKYDLAREYFKRALEIDPNDETVLGNIKNMDHRISEESQKSLVK